MRKSYFEIIGLSIAFLLVIKLIEPSLEFVRANTNNPYAPSNSNAIDYGTGDRYVKFSELPDLREKPRPFPVFKLDMRGGFSDFEIKASTNNFASHSVDDMVYMYVSTRAFDLGVDDPDPYTFYSNELMPDRRKWIYAPPHTSIAGLLMSNSPPGQIGRTDWIYFYPSTNCDVSAKDWMYEGNTNLIWSWVRIDASGYEMNNEDPPRSVWSIIRPDSWEVERTRIPGMP